MRKSHHAQTLYHRTMKAYSHYRRLLSKKARHSHSLRRRHKRKVIPSDWCQQRKQAAQNILCATQGAFVLQDNVYRGDAIRHWLSHQCGNRVLVSLNEIREDPNCCPYCAELTDPSRFGDIRALQAYLLPKTGNCTYLYADHEIEGLEDYYSFRCLVCCTDYRATLQSVLDEADGNRACAGCGYDPTQVFDC
jgi:hypothetical protein